MGELGMSWDRLARKLAHLTCCDTKYEQRQLTPFERTNLETARDYIEIALKNDAVNKEVRS